MQKQLKNKMGFSQNVFIRTTIFLLVFLTILVGMVYLKNRNYYFISLLIIFYSMANYIFAFEKRRPKVRELVILAVLSAIAVAGRSAFFMLPQFKPVIAIIIITGVSLGKEPGFLVGVVTGFVSNFFFGQGPWTPWQMFALGVIGFLAGIFFNAGILKKNRLSLCIFGGFTTFFIYGGLMNLSTLLISAYEVTMAGFLTVCISGIWFDLIHAISTVFFLYFISKPMIEKLERIKIKYGFIDTRL